MSNVDALDKLIEAVEAGEFLLGAMKGRLEENAFDAFSGSLDAAKVLHDAILPGWGYRVSPSYTLVLKPKLIGDYDRFSAAADDNPARAWLLAILKAYRAEVGPKPSPNN